MAAGRRRWRARRLNRITREKDASERRNRARPRVFPGAVEVAKAGAGHDQVGWALAEAR